MTPYERAEEEIERQRHEIERLWADVQWKHVALFNARDYILVYGSISDDRSHLIEQIERAMASTSALNEQRTPSTFSTGEWTSEMGDIVYPDQDQD